MSPILTSLGLRRGAAFTPPEPDPDPFLPTDLENLVLWLDAADLATLTVSGDAVSQWDDKSGLGHHATQGTGSRQPILAPNAINLRPAVRFDGDNDYLELLSNSALDMARNVEGFTAIAVATHPGNASGRLLHINTEGTSSNNGRTRFAIYASGTFDGALASSARRVQSDPEVVALSEQTFDGGAAVVTARAAYTDNALSLRFNGVQVATQAFQATGARSSNTRSRMVWLGSSVTGPAAEPNAVWPGDIAEIICYQRALTPEELAQAEKYLAEKWGISL